MATEEKQISDNPIILEENDDLDKKIKKLLPYVVIFIFLIFQISIFFIIQPTWIDILLFELIETGLLFCWLIINKPLKLKKRLLHSIEKMEEKGYVEYEKFDKTINCTDYSILNSNLPYAWGFFLNIILFWLYEGNFSERIWQYDFFICVLIITIVISFEGSKFRKDKIIVNPHNQTFIVRKNIRLFFYSKTKNIFPWTDVKFEIFHAYNSNNKEKLGFNELSESIQGERLIIHFLNQYQSYFEPSTKEYLETIPKAFKMLIEGDNLSKLSALKALSKYDYKLSQRKIISYSECIILALIEVILVMFTLKFLI